MVNKNIYDTFLRTVDENSLIKDGSKILLGLSGGADSVVTLDLLCKLKEHRDIHIEAAHINHMIRKTALRDEQFCIELCEKYGVRLHVKRIDVPKLSKKLGIGFEECGRNVRYETFNEIMKERSLDICATAHNRDDNAETILLNFIRGSSLRGISGIPYKRGNIIRPILDIRKSDVLNYAESHGLSFMTDETNKDTSYTRNYIRHELIPKIEKINPSFPDTISKNAEIYRRDDIYLNSLAKDILNEAEDFESYLKFKLDALSSLPDSILSRVVYLACERISGDTPDNTVISRAQKAITSNQGNVSETLFKDLSLEISYGYAYFVKQYKPRSFEIPLKYPSGELLIHEAGIKVEYEIFSSNNFKKVHGFIYMDYDTMSGSTFFTSRREGDVFSPYMGAGRRSVKRFMQDYKIPKFLRKHLPVLRCDGDILWICPIERAAAGHTVTKDTKRILCIHVSKINEIKGAKV